MVKCDSSLLLHLNDFDKNTVVFMIIKLCLKNIDVKKVFSNLSMQTKAPSYLSIEL